MNTHNTKTGYVDNIEALSINNTHFRDVIYTTPELQLTLMSLKPGEDIGLETHDDITQFLRIEAGNGKVVLGDEELPVADGSSIIVPAGILHNVINTGETDLKLYSLYTPPEHKHGITHETKEIAEERHADEHFDGETSLG